MYLQLLDDLPSLKLQRIMKLRGYNLSETD